MDFGKMISNRRKELGLTLEQVGDRCGVGKSTVKKWESGMIQNIRRDKIKLLANVLQIDPVSLIDCTPHFIEESKPTASLSPDELRLLTAYRNASEDVQKAAIAMLEAVTADVKKENRA